MPSCPKELESRLVHRQTQDGSFGICGQAFDADTVTGADLAAIPTMTKADVMEHWDEIVTDPRLTLELVETHLERVASEGPAYLLGEYQVLHIVQVQPALLLS